MHGHTFTLHVPIVANTLGVSDRPGTVSVEVLGNP